MAEILVDARGFRCPVPTLKLRRAVERAPAGAVLRLISDDPMARIDAPHYADQAGLDLVSATAEAGVVTVIVRKAG
jgi:tRNA 2-thiouridine synthesizing protein A